MKYFCPKTEKVKECLWRIQYFGKENYSFDCEPTSLCPHSHYIAKMSHQQQLRSSTAPSSAASIPYQRGQPPHQPIISNGGREQFEFIDGTAVEGDNDARKQPQFPSSTSSPIGQQHLGEPQRLIVREMSSSGSDVHRQEENAKILFGPFYRLSKPFFADEFPQRRRIMKGIFFLTIALLLICRAFYYFGQIGQSMNLSLDWARASLQVSLTLNALGALGWMHQNAGYPRKFIRNLLSAIGQNHPPKTSTGTILGAIVISIFFIFTSAIWALMRILELQLNNQHQMNGTNTSNGHQFDYYDYLKINESNGFSIENIYKVSLTCIDAFLAILSGILGALALAIFHLSFRSVLAEWDSFKKEQIDEGIENGRLIQYDFMNRLSISASALLRFAHLISNQFEQLGTGMFMTAIFCNLSASFIGGVTGIKESTTHWPLYEVLEKMNNICWSILSIILLVITVKGPYDVHSKIREIKEKLLLEDSLWTGNDKKLTSFSKNFIARLSGIRIHRIGTQLFQLVFIAQMVLVWLLISGSNCSTAKKI